MAARIFRNSSALGVMAQTRGRRAARIEEPRRGEVEAIAHDGKGIARTPEGKTVFLHGALAGEIVEYRTVRRHRGHDIGETLAVLSASRDRVEPPCPYYERCGGCSLQHLLADRQIEVKQGILLENLRRIGKVCPQTVFEPITGPLWGYRHKARLAVRYVPAKRRVLVGFRERGSAKVAVMDQCRVLHPAVGGRLDELAALIEGLSLRERIPQIEVAIGDEAVALVFRTLDPPDQADISALQAFSDATGIRVWLQPAGADTAAPLSGHRRELSYRLPEFDLDMVFEPLDFTQVNFSINRQLVHRAVSLLAPRADEPVLDLFCGLGNFTLALARRAGSVIGVESVEGLLERARLNAARNGLNNVAFHAEDLYDAAALRDPPWLRAGVRHALLDPPRSGAREVLPLLARAGVERLVYVSCHPASLARDAGILVNELGYTLEGAGVADMFPQTSHVESIAVFHRAAGTSLS